VFIIPVVLVDEIMCSFLFIVGGIILSFQNALAYSEKTGIFVTED